MTDWLVERFPIVLVTNMSMRVGQTLTFKGTPLSESRFAINIGHSQKDIALHLEPRFCALGSERDVVCYSYLDTIPDDCQYTQNFPFSVEEECKICISFTKEEFLITLPDGSKINFHNRQGDEEYGYMSFQGHVNVRVIEVV